jgi:hypothetical protein
MNPQQARARVAETFPQPFNRGRFLEFTRNLLNKFDESKAQAWNSTYIKDAFKNHVSRFERLGTYTSPDQEKLDVLIVHLAGESKLERARTAIRNFVADHLKTRDEKDAALVAFVSPTEKQWRFSYVKMEYAAVETESGRIGVETRLTPARRFSYIVGEGESCHTAQTRFLGLLQDTENDPTLSQLEEAFNVEAVTKEFFSKYAELFGQIQAALDKLAGKDKTIGNEFKAKNVSTVDFAKKLMGQIVFLYFLQKKGWLGVAKGQDWGSGPRDFLRRLARGDHGAYENFFNDVLEPLFYDTLATDRGHEAWCSRFRCRIPFLNGGLFEPLANYDWRKTDIILPNRLFTNNERFDDLITGTGILDVFDRYNFTVNEAEPLEKEVAIDPEMLGKVFENLIEENRRRGLGSFYTPREIVHYMCQESLINYLDTAANTVEESTAPAKSKQTRLFGDSEPEQTDLKATVRHEIVPRPDIETFVRLGEQISHYEAVDAKYTIRMPKSIEQNARLIDKKLADITICDPAVGSGAFPVGMMTEIVRARSALTSYFNDVHERTPYHFKRHAIQDCLYGVDIDPGAVEIAKLRLWLSLVVEEEDVKQIKPLPNLDYKIVTGDSLIGFPFKSPRLQEIERLKQQFFSEADHNSKAALRKVIDAAINECLTTSKRSLGFEVRFDFEIIFSEIFGAAKGFDVVIANPPYGVRIPDREREVYTICLGSVPDFEIFYWFLTLAAKISRQGGALSYIIPNTFLINMYSADYRRKWLEKWRVHRLADLTSFSVFESAVVRNCVVLCERRDRADYTAVICTFGESDAGGVMPLKSVTVPKIALKAAANNWQSLIRADSKTEQLLSKIEIASLRLEEILDAKQGYIPYRKTTLTDRFGADRALRILQERQWHSDSKDSPDHKRELQGKDVLRYRIEWSGVWVKYGNWVSSYVDLKYFAKPRLLFREITRPLPYALLVAYSEDEFVNNPSIITAVHRQTMDFDFRFLLGVCNSRLVSFYFLARAPKAEKGLFPKILVNDVRQLPIPRVQKDEQVRVSQKVDRILAAKRRDAETDTSGLEREIDELVYALYGLSSEEIKLVEGAGK